MQCWNCKAEIKNDSSICIRCGTLIKMDIDLEKKPKQRKFYIRKLRTPIFLFLLFISIFIFSFTKNHIILKKITSIDEISVNSILSKSSGGYAYSLELDKIVNEIMIDLKEANSNFLEYTNNKEKYAKEILTNFIKAEIISKYPDLRTEEEIRKNKKIPKNELQGGIKIIRKDTSVNKEEEEDDLEYEILDSDQILTYVRYNYFTRLINENNGDVKKYYSIKPKVAQKYGDFCVPWNNKNIILFPFYLKKKYNELNL